MNCKGYSEFEQSVRALFHTLYSVYPDIFLLSSQSSAYQMGYMRHLFFVKRGILIGSYIGLKVLFFFFFFLGRIGMFKLPSRLIKLSVETKQISGYLFPTFE